MSRKPRKGQIAGHRIVLDGERWVFLGRHEGRWALVFYNAQNETPTTSFALTDDALDAVVSLHAKATGRSGWDGIAPLIFRCMTREMSLIDRLLRRGNRWVRLAR